MCKKLFKDYCVEYLQSGNVVFNELVGTKRKWIGKNDETGHLEQEIEYAVPDLNKIYFSLMKKHSTYIIRRDFEQLYLDYLMRFFEKELPEYDLDNLSDEDLRSKFYGCLRNWINAYLNENFGEEYEDENGLKKRPFKEDSLEAKNPDEESEFDRLGSYIAKKFTTDKPNDEFMAFLRTVDIEDYLLDKQKPIYPYIKQYYNLFDYENNRGSISRKEIADKLGKSEQAIKKMEKTIAKRIGALYSQWNKIRKKHEVPLAQVIIDLLSMIDESEMWCDPESRTHNTFILFISWIRKYYRKGEALDEGINFEKMQQNKKEDKDTIFSILTDNFNSVKIKGDDPTKQWGLLKDILEHGQVLKLDDRQKRNLVYRCTMILENYLHKKNKYLRNVLESIDKNEEEAV